MEAITVGTSVRRAARRERRARNGGVRALDAGRDQLGRLHHVRVQRLQAETKTDWRTRENADRGMMGMVTLQ